MGIAETLGVTFEQFVADWCLGTTPSLRKEQIDEALDAVDRHLPERINALRAENSRGIPTLAPTIIVGEALSACETMYGFAPILERVRNGEEAAISELRFARVLKLLGFEPVLEPELAGRRPDTLVKVDGLPVYCEVTAPELSEALQSVYESLAAATSRLMSSAVGFRTDVYFLSEDALGDDALISHSAREVEPGDHVHEVSGRFLIRKQRITEVPPQSITPADAPTPILFVASGTNEGGVLTQANAGLAVSDRRAVQLFERERHHFQPDKANLLVMDVGRVPGGIQRFPDLIRARLRPDMNTRFGGVLLMEEPIVGNSFAEERYEFIANPHARFPLPSALTEALERLTRRRDASYAPLPNESLQLTEARSAPSASTTPTTRLRS